MADLVDLIQWKQKKADEFARGGRTPLYVSHLTGKVTGSPHGSAKRPEPPVAFNERLQRIRASLDKINRLMNELKQMSDERRNTPEP